MSHAMPPDSGRSGGSTERSGARSSLQVRSLNGEPQTPDQIEAEIEVQREQLAETIDALSAKLDVKSQAQAKVEEAKRTAQSKVAQVKQSAQSTVGSAQAKVGSASSSVRRKASRSGASGSSGSSSGSLRPELLAFGITVVVATAVLWWRER